MSKISDPAQRQTLMEYDSEGNLINIVAPDNSTSQWQYDDDHHMIGEIDGEGNTATATYDQFGRASSATQEDGSVVRLNPLETQGLSSFSSTSAPIGKISQNTSYVDANGNVTQSKLDGAGQKISSLDAEGRTETVKRNQENLITSKIDARGFETKYTYDELGNVLTVEESLTSASNLRDQILIVNFLELLLSGLKSVSGSWLVRIQKYR